MARCKRKIKDDAVASFDEYGRSIRPVTQRLQQNFRVEICYAPASKTSFTARAEYVEVSYRSYQTIQTGYLFSAALRQRMFPSLDLSLRAAAVHTTSYDSRLYMYEQDVPGAISNAGLSSDGIRLYILATWKPLQWMNLSLKYGETINQAWVSSGTGTGSVEVESPGRLSLQMDVAFR